MLQPGPVEDLPLQAAAQRAMEIDDGSALRVAPGGEAQLPPVGQLEHLILAQSSADGDEFGEEGSARAMERVILPVDFASDVGL